jgi:cell volume regulation protein A
MFLRQMLLGGLLGFAFGKIGSIAINKITLDYEGLYIVLVIAIMFFSFSATDFIGGNGFLSVYITAVFLGNQELIHKKKILKSFDSFAWLMQIILFLTLGLLVFPKQIIPVVGIGLIISVFLIAVARPLSVFISLIPFKVQRRSRLFISWVGLRGAVPIVFATYPLIAGAEKANMIFNIVFFISITSVLIQGTSLPLVARWLHLTLPEKLKQRSQTDIALNDGIMANLTEIVIPDNCSVIGKQIVQLGLPKTTLISIIQRESKFITPNGSTTLMSKDRLYVLTEKKELLKQVFDCLKIEKDENNDK